MLIPIGKITEDNKIKAAIIYDSENLERKLMTISELLEETEYKQNVYGMCIHLKNDGSYGVKRNKRFYWDMIPECNGRCEPEVDNDKELRILLGVNDEKSNRCYILSNTLGHVEVMNSSEIKDFIGKKKVIGAKIGKDGRVMIYTRCKFSEFHLRELGYEFRNNNWTAIQN